MEITVYLKGLKDKLTARAIKAVAEAVRAQLREELTARPPSPARPAPPEKLVYIAQLTAPPWTGIFSPICLPTIQTRYLSGYLYRSSMATRLLLATASGANAPCA